MAGDLELKINVSKCETKSCPKWQKSKLDGLYSLKISIFNDNKNYFKKYKNLSNEMVCPSYILFPELCLLRVQVQSNLEVTESQTNFSES